MLSGTVLWCCQLKSEAADLSIHMSCCLKMQQGFNELKEKLSYSIEQTWTKDNLRISHINL